MAAETRPLAEIIDALERRFGKGETYTRAEREAIGSGRVPEWLFRIAHFHADAQLASHCKNLIDQIEIAYREGGPGVRFEGAPLDAFRGVVPPENELGVPRVQGQPRPTRKDHQNRFHPSKIPTNRDPWDRGKR